MKLWYAGPFFRYEAPQKGRFRQFNQIGAEAIGTESPLADAELIVLLDELLRGLGIDDVELRLGSLGSPEARVRPTGTSCAPTCASTRPSSPTRSASRIDTQPDARLRLRPRGHPRRDGGGADDARAARGRGRRALRRRCGALLDGAGVPYALDPTLVRGLDYYTRTVFEFTCERLGAQSGLGGGGRYDGLVELLGGPPTPGVGWAAGIERILLALTEAPPAPRAERVFVVCADARGRLRADPGAAPAPASPPSSTSPGAPSRGQMKQADRSGAASR